MVKGSRREANNEKDITTAVRSSGPDSGTRDVETPAINGLLTKFSLGRRSPATPFPAKQYKPNGRRGTVAGQGLIGWAVAGFEGRLGAVVLVFRVFPSRISQSTSMSSFPSTSISSSPPISFSFSLLPWRSARIFSGLNSGIGFST